MEEIQRLKYELKNLQWEEYQCKISSEYAKSSPFSIAQLQEKQRIVTDKLKMIAFKEIL